MKGEQIVIEGILSHIIQSKNSILFIFIFITSIYIIAEKIYYLFQYIFDNYIKEKW